MKTHDEFDSLMRAVAAAPSVSPPEVSALAIRGGDEGTVRGRVKGGELTVEPDGTILAVFAGADVAAQAASSALAVHAASPGTGLAIATGVGRESIVERVHALGEGDRIVLDERTAAMLAGRFDVRGSELHGPTRAPEPAAAPRPAGGPEQMFARALDDERMRSAARLLRLRLAMGGALGLIFAALGYLKRPGLPEAVAAFPVICVYLVIGTLLLLAVRARPALKAASWYAVPLLDLPVAFVIQDRAVAISATPDLSAGMTLAGFLVGLFALQLSMQPRILVATAVMEIALEALVCSRGGQWQLFPFAVFLVAFGTLFGVYVPLRVQALLRRVAVEETARVDELEARNREVRVLNDELRRQIGDRARHLAEALMRLTTGPAASRALAAGELVDQRYRVVDRLGIGGMGAVYRVERVTDGRHLALKVLTGVADREALIRFAREAQIAAELDHPNVVAAVDLGVSQSGMLFIVMELVPGKTLADRRGSYGDAPWAVPLLRQIASALAALHARGIVHRDLKPSNVLLDGDTAKVADFGIASLTEKPLGDDDTVGRGITHSGAFLGTPLYMAPELRLGARQATPRADVYSLGVLAFEILAKRLPFAAPPVLERMHGRSPPPPLSLAEARPDLPRALADLVDGCLSDAPEARPTAEAIVAALA